MLSRTRAWFVLVSLLLALTAACKERVAIDQGRPLPTPEPPATTAATPPKNEAAPVPKKRAPADEIKKEADEKGGAAVDGSRGAAAASVSATPRATPTAPTASTSAVPAPALTVPPLTAPSAACLSRCQGALQGCLAAPVDGGVPGFANLDLCKKAFEACQSACAAP